MAMTMTGEVLLPADQQTVWEKLNDPEVLKRCIPGCETLEKVGDNELQASAKIAVGPVKATFKGKVTLTDIDPPNGYRITGEGQGGVSGTGIGKGYPGTFGGEAPHDGGAYAATATQYQDLLACEIAHGSAS